MVQFPLLPSPRATPRDKVSRCGPGVGNFASSLVPGVGIIEVSSRARNYGRQLALNHTGRHVPAVSRLNSMNLINRMISQVARGLNSAFTVVLIHGMTSGPVDHWYLGSFHATNFYSPILNLTLESKFPWCLISCVPARNNSSRGLFWCQSKLLC